MNTVSATSVEVIAADPSTTLANILSGIKPISPIIPAASICATAKMMPATIPKLMPSLIERRMACCFANDDPRSAHQLLDHHGENAEHDRPKQGEHYQAGDVRLRRRGTEAPALDQQLLQDSLQIGIAHLVDDLERLRFLADRGEPGADVVGLEHFAQLGECGAHRLLGMTVGAQRARHLFVPLRDLGIGIFGPHRKIELPAVTAAPEGGLRRIGERSLLAELVERALLQVAREEAPDDLLLRGSVEPIEAVHELALHVGERAGAGLG